MVGIAVLCAVLLGVPLGVWIAHRPGARRWVLGIVNIFQTIPSLALFGFLIPVPWIGGIGRRTAVIALVLYALLPVVRNTLTGMVMIDASVRECAVAMGMTARQMLRLVELPLAAPSIMAGVRIAAVTTVGTATIAAAIGAGGLGELIFRGLASIDYRQILAGALPAAALALALEGAFEWVERRFFRRY